MLDACTLTGSQWADIIRTLIGCVALFGVTVAAAWAFVRVEQAKRGAPNA